MALAGLLDSGRVMFEDDAAAVRADVETVGVAAGARQLQAAAFHQQADPAAGHVQAQQLQHPPNRQVFIEMAVLGLAGGQAAFQARGELALAPVLCRQATQLGPDPGHEDDVAAVRHPLEGLDAGSDFTDAAGLAAVGSDQIQLPAFVTPALLLAPGQKAIWRPSGDQAGWLSLSPHCVSARAATWPAVGSSHS